MTPDVGILGAGLMGLTLAHLLLRRGARVTVYEAEPEPGGLLRSATLGGVRFDRFYHCVLPTDADLLWLLGDLGLADRVAWRRTRAGFLHEGRLHSLDGVVDFLRFPPLTFAQRLRLGWTIFRTSRIRGWQEVDETPVEDYLVRLGGRAAFERVWRPLLRSKLGETYTETSAAFIWSTINRLYAARATPDRSEKLGFLCGSYEVVLERLLESIRARGGEVRTGFAVDRLQPEPGGLRVAGGGGGRAHDAVVATIPPSALARIVTAIDPVYADSLRRFRFHGVRVHVLLLAAPLTPYYVVNLTEPDAPLTGVVEMGNLAPEGYFGEGRSLVYLPLYAHPEAPEYRRDEREFRAICLRFLQRLRPGFGADQIVAETAFRAPSVLPIPTLGFGRTLPAVRTPVPRLFFAHNLHVYPRPLHNDAVVSVARRIDQEIAGSLAAGSA